MRLTLARRALAPLLLAAGLTAGCSSDSTASSASADTLVADTAGADGSDASDDTAGAPADGPTWNRDIAPLVAAMCSSCHTDGGIGPFPLETYEQVAPLRMLIASEVKDRIMPPWLPAPGCNTYKGDRSLSPEQIDAIVAWSDAGAPRGEADEVPNTVSAPLHSLSRVDYELPLKEPYTPSGSPDDYRCFFLDWPETDTTYITGFGVAPDNADMVHHAIAYIARPDKIAFFQGLDDEDETPGWPCFGGPGGEASGPGTATWIGGWAPGGTGDDFPEGTGVELPAGSKIIVQLHYNLEGVTPRPDRTKVLLRTAKTVQKRAGVLPFADPAWVTKGTMDIPAHSSGVKHSVDLDPTTVVKLLTAGGLEGGRPLRIYGVGMHMHTMAVSGGTRVDRAAGDSVCLVDIPRWDFHWQTNQFLDEPVVVQPGDTLHVECAWDNPGDEALNWGENTSDEMCLGIYYVTEE